MKFRLPWFHRDRIDRDIDDELAFHVEAHVRDLIGDGVAPEEARRRARLILSDMAANTVGHKQTDHLRTMVLVEAGAHPLQALMSLHAVHEEFRKLHQETADQGPGRKIL